MGILKLIRFAVVALAGYIAYKVVTGSFRGQQEKQRSSRKGRKYIKSKVIHDKPKQEQ